jgi:hypothetical protein
MSTNNYFWQGRHKIEIEQTENAITIDQADLESVGDAAKEAGITLQKTQEIAPNSIKTTVRLWKNQCC